MELEVLQEHNETQNHDRNRHPGNEHSLRPGNHCPHHDSGSGQVDGEGKVDQDQEDSQANDYDPGTCRKVVASRKGSVFCTQQERRASGALVI